MERLIDKVIVLLCCLPALALVSVDVGMVVSFLVAVGFSALVEVFGLGEQHRASRLACDILPLAYCALACLFLQGIAFLPLATYDLARSSRGPAVCCVVAVPLVLAAARGVPAVELASALLTSAAFAMLSLRTGHVIGQREKNLRDRDELSARSQKLEERMSDLQDRQEYDARLATLTERARIARDIHDNVGHLITRAIVQVEAYKVVHANDSRVEGEFSNVADTLHEALDTLRTSVHGMADDACDLSVQLRHVAEEACAGTGLSLTCQIAAGEASPAVVACLLAVTREAISNTLRHAEGATSVRVELVEHPGFWRLSVADNGKTPAPGQDGGRAGGMGLQSMEERVRALGGTLSADFSPTAGGFVVYASIPRKGNDR